jgi:hypothetical protein
MHKRLLAAAVAAASLALAGQASATTYNLTFTGTVTSAFDGWGASQFGSASSLVGQSFVAHVSYDNVAKSGAVHSSDVWYDDLSGSGAANPVTADIKLNGITVSFGSTSGYDNREDRSLLPGCAINCTTASFQLNAASKFTDSNGIYNSNYVNLGGISKDGAISGFAHTAIDYTNPPVDLYAFLFLSEEDANYNTLVYTEISAKIDSISGGEPWTAPVPEPATWAMMLVGFGGLGATMRRRRSGAALAD